MSVRYGNGKIGAATAVETASALPAVNSSVRMAGGQCPLKGGAIDHHRCHGELVNQLTTELTN